MYIDEVLTDLQNLTQRKITYEELAPIFNMSGNAMRNWVYRKRVLKPFEIAKIYNHFSLVPPNISQNIIKHQKNNEIYKIPYWSELPDALKNTDFSCVTAEYKVITHHWGFEPENLCIVPMVGDKMTNYWYPIKNGDILIINTAQNYILGNGVYFATSRNNTRYWIREMQILVNDNIELKGFAPSGNTTRILLPEEAEDVDFKIIGKVIKNVSFKL